MAKTIRELKSIPTDKLIEEHDQIVTQSNIVVGVDYYLAELRSRESASREAAMVRLTWVIAILTFVVTVATIINLLVFVYGA